MFVARKLRQIYKNDSVIARKFLMGDTLIFCELSQLGYFHYMHKVTAIANKLRISAKNNPDPLKKILFSKSLSELAIYLLQKHSFIDEYNLSIKRHLDFILENALRYDQKRWIDDIQIQYKEQMRLRHKVLISVASNRIGQILALNFIHMFINLPRNILRKFKTVVLRFNH